MLRSGGGNGAPVVLSAARRDTAERGGFCHGDRHAPVVLVRHVRKARHTA